MDDKSTQKDGGNTSGKYTPPSRRLGMDGGANDGVVVVRTSGRGGGVPIHYSSRTPITECGQ